MPERMVGALKRGREFRRVYREGKSVSDRLLVLYYLKGSAQEISRVGITVGHRVGPAVHRNRVKRLIKESIRSKEGIVKRGYELVVVAKNDSCHRNFREIDQSMDSLLQKARIIPG
ncbi:ribonuclease P protein component [Candidatus Hakubella thermalkaliphila]|uniref:Ribonuclease P protein component n=1 Tax=Candidatus Hakubella thermalkaliphila TaxID=2754717 RepID=A0A6V8PMS8_9ACTN|nr:ribonuclease P protein component [Candidatus Hakubella thermalkaliphila]